jgi:hypothetical protein
MNELTVKSSKIKHISSSKYGSMEPNIIRMIMTYLDKKNIIVARRTCSAWFNAKQYTQNIHFNKEFVWSTSLGPLDYIDIDNYINVTKSAVPLIVQRSGIDTVMNYATRFYERNHMSCIRAMAIAAIAIFAHKDLQSRYVLSYDREKDIILWCLTNDLIKAVFSGQNIIAFEYSLDEFNNKIFNKDNTSLIKKHSICYQYSINRLDPESRKVRYSVTFSANLCLPFFHASACCVGNSYGKRCSIDCYMIQDIMKVKRERQKATKIRQKQSNSNELCINDNEHFHHTRNVIVQEKRGSKGYTSFKVSYIGIDAL